MHALLSTTAGLASKFAGAAGPLMYRGIVLLLAVVALGATLELAQTLNVLWQRFPAPLGIHGLVIVAVSLIAGMVGLAGVIRLPVKWALAVAFGVLIATRIGALLLVEPTLVRDQASYDALARGVLEGECCFGMRAMGYPMLLAIPYALGLSGKVVNCVFALAAGPLLYVLARDLAGERAGAAAVYLYAIAPSLILYSGVLMTETVYATVVLLALVTLTWRSRRIGSLASGVFLGLSQYVRATSVFLAPALALPLLRRGGPRDLGLFAAALFITLLPVLAATGGFSTSTVGGLSLLMGTNQEWNGRYNQDDVALYTSWGADRESRAVREGINRIISDPAGFAALAVRKSHIMWGQEYHGVVFAMTDAGLPEHDRAPARLLSQLVYVVILIGAALASWRFRKQPPDTIVAVLGVFVTVAALHTFLEVQPRFHAYVVPLLVVVAAAAAFSRRIDRVVVRSATRAFEG